MWLHNLNDENWNLLRSIFVVQVLRWLESEIPEKWGTQVTEIRKKIFRWGKGSQG